jgi:hypothetical protein
MEKKKDKININEDYEILVNSFSKKISDHFFFSKEFFNYYSQSNLDFYFELLQKNKNKVMGIFPLYFSKNNYHSPLKGTYSGVHFDEDLDLEILELFIVNCKAYIITKNKFENIYIKLPPLIHDLSGISKLLNIFLRNNFKLSNFEINHHLKVSDKKYELFLSKGNLKKLKIAEKKYTIKEDDFSKIEEFYNVLEINRRSKGNNISMNLEDFKNFTKEFIKNIKIFSVINKNIIIAAAYCIRINKEILYVFYWGELPLFKSDSPVVYLSKSIYEYSKNKDIDIIDVGTSSVSNIPNHGLVRFKNRIGYTESLKINLICNEN